MILWTFLILALINLCYLNGKCKSENIEYLANEKGSNVTITGRAIVNAMENEEIKISTKLNVAKTNLINCPKLENADTLTQNELFNRLTAPCRYDRRERPSVLMEDGTLSAIDVNVHVFIYVMQSLDSSILKLRVHGLLQLRYLDHRLAFEKYTPNGHQSIIGKAELRERLWVPHIFLANEQESRILGTNEKDILTSISSDGTVILSSRFKATLYCRMELKKFPFDEQFCTTILESWNYNTSEMILLWENNLASISSPKLQLTKYSLLNTTFEEKIVIADENNLRHGSFAGNYSTLRITVHLERKYRRLFLSYFIPSIVIVIVSFSSFWLRPSETSPRNTLSTSTLISFVILTISQNNNNFSNYSPINLSDIWALSCILFIFGTLIEVAFVNKIWSRKRNVVLKKVNSRHILKSTMIPRGDKRGGLQRGTSYSNFEFNGENGWDNAGEDGGKNKNWASMTPQEVAFWIDGKARLWYPLAFLIFNIVFWTLVFCL